MSVRIFELKIMIFFAHFNTNPKQKSIKKKKKTDTYQLKMFYSQVSTVV